MSRRAPLICGLVAFAVFVSGAARTIQGGDVAELSLTGTFGGVAHPPGYPLWSMLARIAAALPLGAPVTRLSLFSALCAAACVAMTVRIAQRLGAGAPAACASALALALALPFWRMAGVPEVFALAALLASLIVDASLTLEESGSARAALALGAALGLAAAHHQTSVLLVPLAIAALARAPSRAPLVVLPALGGLLLYAWLPLAARAASAPAFVWGEPGTLSGLADHVLRREYGTLRLGVGAAPRDPLGSALWLAKTATLDVFVAPVAAAAAGAWISWRSRRAMTAALLLSIALSGVAFPALFNVGSGPLAREVQARFAILPLVLLAPLAALGLSAALDWFVRHAEFGARPARAAGIALLFAPVALELVRGWPARWRGDRFVEEWHAVAASHAERDAVILGGGDVSGPAFAWVRATRGGDARYVDVNLVRLRWYFERELLSIPGVTFAFDEHTTHLGALVDALAVSHPVYVIPSIAPLVAQSHALHVEGLLLRVGPEDAERDRSSLALAAAALPVSAPADAWSASQRDAVRVVWSALADELERAGRVAEAEDARGRAVP